MGGDGRAGGDRPTASRLSTARLAVATAVAVLLGTGWWVSNAPPPSSRTAALPLPSSAPGTLAGSAAGDATVVAADQPGPMTVRADPPHRPVPRAAPDYPTPGEILRFDVAEVEARLPAGDGVLQRRAGVLTAGGGIDLSGPVPAGGRYRVDITCQGDGDLWVIVAAPGGSGHEHTQPCDGSLDSIEITTSTTGMATILLQARAPRLIGVAVQLVQR